MQAFRIPLMITIGALLLLTVSACDRTITRVEQVAQTPLNCFECHSDQETFLVSAQAQYEHSVHASGDRLHESDSGCSGCHTSEGFVARANGESPEDYDNPTAIHCFTCHAPHTNGDFHLRLADAQSLEDGTSYDVGSGNLCVACHHARRDVNTYVSDKVKLSSHWGPHHGPQGDMFFASNGYEYPDYDYERLTFHLNLTEDGCLDCHFKTTSNYVVGGHSFNMEGETEAGSTVLNVAACNLRCHDNLDDFNYHGVQDSVVTLAATLRGLLEDAGLMDEGGTLSVTTSADSAGALWNYLIVEEDRSEGVHNSKYEIGLLESAIMYLQGDLPATAAETPAETALPELTRR